MKKWLQRIFDSLSGEPIEFEKQGSASKLMLVATLLLAAAGCSAVFGLAAGSTAVSMALANLVKLPLVVIVSGFVALPASLLALRVFGSPMKAADLWLSQAAAMLAATLVLASFSPLVGLFYHSSQNLGGIVAVGTVFVAIGSGLYVFGRSMKSRISTESKRALVPAIVLILLQILAIVQLVALVSPILPEVTPFAQGADGFVSVH